MIWYILMRPYIDKVYWGKYWGIYWDIHDVDMDATNMT